MSEEPLFQPSGLNICIFPHLQEFLVIDARPNFAPMPTIYLLCTDEVLDPEFYHDLEEIAVELVRAAPRSFAELGNLPQKIDEAMREQTLRAILRCIGLRCDEDDLPDVSVFLCAGSTLTISPPQVDEAVKTMVGRDPDPSALNECLYQLHRLIDDERTHARADDAEMARQAVSDQGDHYFTLWSRDHSEPYASSDS